MKPFIVFISLMSISSCIWANDVIEEKKEINRAYEKMTCAELKAGLLEIAEEIAELKELDQNSMEFEVNMHSLKKAIEKASACIN